MFSDHLVIGCSRPVAEKQASSSRVDFSGLHTVFVARALIWLCDCNAADGFVFSRGRVRASRPPSYSVRFKFHYNDGFVSLNILLAACRAAQRLAEEEKHLLE